MLPELIAAFMEAYWLAFNKAGGWRRSGHDAARKELAQIGAKITRLTTAI